MAPRFITFFTAGTLFMVGALANGAQGSAMAVARKEIGLVTFSLGQASVIRQGGVVEPVRKGSRIMTGDRLETTVGGHVHIRFVDDALVSVRPSSRLLVEEYDYQPQKVANSQVKFRLETGVARAISGAAAEGAKERFRLNTPLVAIGVRGTDFVVRSAHDQTTAHVNQGAIVMTPLGDGCQASAQGPCNTSTAMLVSAQMGNVLAEYRNGLIQPELKPYFAQYARTVDGNSPSAGRLGSGEVTSDTQTVVKNDHAAAGKPEIVAQVNQVVGKELMVSVVETLPDPTPAPTPTPVPPPAVVEPPPVVVALDQMRWGHWSKPTGAADLSEPYRVAGLGREVTIGNSTHVLYRDFNHSGLTAIQPSLGVVGFKLEMASAQFRPWGGSYLEAAAHTGKLSIDFAARKFETSLALEHALAGQHTLNQSGVLLKDGIFGGSITGQSVVGATTFDASSAGYLFDKTVGAGAFSGITLWGK